MGEAQLQAPAARQPASSQPPRRRRSRSPAAEPGRRSSNPKPSPPHWSTWLTPSEPRLTRHRSRTLRSHAGPPADLHQRGHPHHGELDSLPEGRPMKSPAADRVDELRKLQPHSEKGRSHPTEQPCPRMARLTNAKRGQTEITREQYRGTRRRQRRRPSRDERQSNASIPPSNPTADNRPQIGMLTRNADAPVYLSSDKVTARTRPWSSPSPRSEYSERASFIAAFGAARLARRDRDELAASLAKRQASTPAEVKARAAAPTAARKEARSARHNQKHAQTSLITS